MRRGFTLIELVIVIAIAAIVVTIAMIAMNPRGQLAQARNGKRQADLSTIMNAIRSNSADTRTGFTCAAGNLPTSTKKMANGAGNYDIASCLVPTYIFSLPVDPSASGAHYTSNSDYDTGYTIIYNASTTQVTLSAPAAELGVLVSVTR